MRRALAAAIAIAALLPTGPAAAATPRTTLNDVEDEVMCVTCNVPLNIAQSPQADRERAEIQRLVDQGLTKEQIKRRLKAIYGPNVLALPSSKGFNLAAYAVPIGLVAAMLAAVALLVTRWRRDDGSGPPEPPTDGGDPGLDPDDERRLDEDLARYGA
jgi:cytochrome c-type biogenesis protein CcmH/NrfF